MANYFNLTSLYATADNALNVVDEFGAHILATTANGFQAVETIVGALSNTELVDYYRFTSAKALNLDASLSNISDNVDSRLIRDSNRNGYIDRGDATIGSDNPSNGRGYMSAEGLGSGTSFLTSSYSTADNTLNGAYDFGAIILGTNANGFRAVETITGALSSTDLVDYYRFTSAKAFNLDVSLSNMSGNVDLRLIRDANRNGYIDRGDAIIGSYNPSNSREYMHIEGLGGGTYFLEAKSADRSTTNYLLELTATAGILGEPLNVDSNTPNTAIEIAGQLNGNRYFKGNVNSSSDSNDFYHFRLDQATDFNAFLLPKSSNANLYLYADLDSNRVLDPGELIGFSAQTGTTTDFIDKEILSPGDYYLQVQKPSNTGATDYDLSIQGGPVSRAKITLDISELKALEKFDTGFWGTNWHRADFYGTVTIEGTKHQFGTYQDRDVLTGLKFSQFVDPNDRFISFSIEVYDEDGLVDDYTDISPWGSSADIKFTYDTVKQQIVGGWGMPHGITFREGQSVKLQGDGAHPGFESIFPSGSNAASITFAVNYDANPL